MSDLLFISPVILNALYFLPPLWLLLRFAPVKEAERRKNEDIPILSFGITALDGEPPLTPAWLTLLRLFIVSLVIVGLSRPVNMTVETYGTKTPFILVIDNGQTSVKDWEKRISTAVKLTDYAIANKRPVLLLLTAETSEKTGLMSANKARSVLLSIQPSAMKTNRNIALKTFQDIADSEIFNNGANTVWISDGLDSIDDSTENLIDNLRRFGKLKIITAESIETKFIVDSKHIKTALKNLGVKTKASPALYAPARLLLKPEWKHSRLKISALRAADSKTPVERLWFKVFDRHNHIVQHHYLEYGFGKGKAEVFLDFPPELAKDIAWIELENHNKINLIPEYNQLKVGLIGKQSEIPLLDGVYYIKQALAPFAEISNYYFDEQKLQMIAVDGTVSFSESEEIVLDNWVKKGGVLVNFAGENLKNNSLLPIKLHSNFHISADTGIKVSGKLKELATPLKIHIEKILVAEPDSVVNAEIWAKLDDKTPLVTAKKSGKGWLVLVHVTASPEWSDLPLSGFYMQMMKRFLEVTPRDSSVYLNLKPLKIPFGVKHKTFNDVKQLVEYKPYLLMLAFILTALDLFVSFSMYKVPVSFKKAIILFGFIFSMLPANVQAYEVKLMQENRIGYIQTGNNQIDKASYAGLANLSKAVSMYTKIEIKPPAAIDIETDSMLLFPVVYWHLTGKALSPVLKGKIKRYVKKGGIILFNISEQENVFTHKALEKLIDGIEKTHWEKISSKHLLLKTFYKFESFPDYYTKGNIWASTVGVNKVSFLVANSNLTEIWAKTPINKKQTFGFGINLMIYAVAGDYFASGMNP
ncbi:MAG: DUF4159 domain-containing protein [Alphaproteobacteria bacterium]|nr:DUF4159 domain-containing protein [Alphaproteobacteria bacterium]